MDSSVFIKMNHKRVVHYLVLLVIFLIPFDGFILKVANHIAPSYIGLKYQNCTFLLVLLLLVAVVDGLRSLVDLVKKWPMLFVVMFVWLLIGLATYIHSFNVPGSFMLFLTWHVVPLIFLYLLLMNVVVLKCLRVLSVAVIAASLFFIIKYFYFFGVPVGGIDAIVNRGNLEVIERMLSYDYFQTNFAGSVMVVWIFFMLYGFVIEDCKHFKPVFILASFLSLVSTLLLFNRSGIYVILFLFPPM